jgi:methyl-accepting chemotaxis protein
VLNSAERSQSNSQNVAQRIADLSSHTRRIAEILEVIRDLANRSELLALNAGLEGTKAGEAGRGFSHVAAQMQRFSESVMGSVKRIRELTVTITEATDATVLATEESTKLASDATRAAEQIGRIIQEQRLATEQATESMMNVGEVAAQSASGSKVIVSSATALATLSDQLQSLVGHFQLGDEGPKSPDDD